MPDGAVPLHDMHVHLAFIDGADQVARDASEKGGMLFSCTVTPQEYGLHVREARSWFGSDGAPLLGRTVFPGVGMHPWWVRPERVAQDVDLIGRALAPMPAPLIGEVGLDFSPRHRATKDAQVEAFAAICSLAARAADGRPRPVISIHAVQSASTVLDVLESTGCLDPLPGHRTRCACVLHWFSGTSDEMGRAVGAGCYFSIGPRMVASKRGREYARQIPVRRLLLETDDPEGEGAVWPYGRIRAGLTAALDAIAQAKKAATDEQGRSLASTLDRTARMLLLGQAADGPVA